jgi:hypothetical protein
MPGNRAFRQTAMAAKPIDESRDQRGKRHGFRLDKNPGGQTALAEKIRKPAGPVDVFGGEAIPAPGATAPAAMAREALKYTVVKVANVHTGQGHPGAEMTRRTLIRRNGQRCVTQFGQIACKCSDSFGKFAGFHAAAVPGIGRSDIVDHQGSPSISAECAAG